MLLDALLSEKADGTLILCRGVPQSWKRAGNRIQLLRVPVRGGRVDFEISYEENIRVALTGAVGGRRIVLDDAEIYVPQGETECHFSL